MSLIDQERTSCGILLLTQSQPISFLLMKHHDRWDLPKGHIDPGETRLECALREFEEETGILRSAIEIDRHFSHEETYEFVRSSSQSRVRKTLVVFLARIPKQVNVCPTEHLGYAWIPWAPPHRIQEKTIDPLLTKIENHLLQLGALPGSMRNHSDT